ncbi:unnamed protein product [Phyllotreta striolata]|uniref:CRAL-TRIO domain-containing protein n=1 Tax=Phyllotreta striolata TaxID=444603 RepID=A0A9N9XPI7_PHYSR|nr:unnamed protein product [Phyllotreta striolata]
MNGDDEKIRILREWIAKQPHLPQKSDENLVRRFLKCCNDSIERSKQLIDLYYTLRSHVPEVYSNRDPTAPEIQRIFENIQFLPLPKFTKDNHQLFVYRILTSDIEHYDFVNSVKAFSMVADVRMVEETAIADGEVPIFDMKNFTAKHITKVVFPVMKKLLIYSQEAHPMKLKEVHYVNAPPFLNKFLSILKPIIKSDVLQMIHFHPPNSETLFEHVPKELLPEEYGGTIGKCDDIANRWQRLVLQRKDYLTDDGYWKVEEIKRSANEGNPDYLGIQGSFKTISID